MTSPAPAAGSNIRLAMARSTAQAHEVQRGWGRGYPNSPMLEPDFSPTQKMRAALREHRNQRRPFRQFGDGWMLATSALYSDMARACDIPAPQLRHKGPFEGHSGESSYNVSLHRVTLCGRESVITALHEFAHALGYGETGATWWSVNHFAATWPRSYARLDSEPGSHVLTLPVAGAMA